MNRAAHAAYRHAEIDTLSQRDLIVRLYLGAEDFLAQAQSAMREHRHESAFTACQKAKRIFSELLATLNFELGGDIARQLRDLYVFLITRIAEADLRGRPEMLAEIMPVIVNLRQAWEQIPAEHANLSSLQANEGHALSVRT